MRASDRWSLVAGVMPRSERETSRTMTRTLEPKRGWQAHGRRARRMPHRAWASEIFVLRNEQQATTRTRTMPTWPLDIAPAR